MRDRRGSDVLFVVMGWVILAGGFLHAFGGWPPLSAALRAAGVDASIAAGLAVGWMFGSAAMVAMGLCVLVAARHLRSGDALAAQVGSCVGGAWLTFGIGASVYRFPNPHFLFFIVVGGLLVAASRLSGRPA